MSSWHEVGGGRDRWAIIMKTNQEILDFVREYYDFQQYEAKSMLLITSDVCLIMIKV